MNDSAEDPRKGRYILVGLFALFFAPLLAAMVYYWLAPAYAPPPRANGELIDPPRALEAFSAPTLSGDPVDLEGLRGRWQLVHVITGPCGEGCRERLYHTRQVRDALGEDRTRVARLAVIEADGADTGMSGLLEGHPRLRVLPAGGASGLLRQLPQVHDNRTVYLLDPLGNLMMRFPASLEPGAMLDDLEKLLKLSRIG